MAAPIQITVDARSGFERVAATFGRLPRATERAQARALRKLATWLKRQALRAAGRAAGIPQKFFQQAMRYYVDLTDTGLSVWIGTNPIPQHRLGTVTWNRGMRGAKVGRRSFPRSWSWGPGSKTGSAIMRRIGAARLPIARVPDEQPHPAVLAALSRLQADASARFDTLLRQELNYALNVEARR